MEAITRLRDRSTDAFERRDFPELVVIASEIMKEVEKHPVLAEPLREMAGYLGTDSRYLQLALAVARCAAVHAPSDDCGYQAAAAWTKLLEVFAESKLSEAIEEARDAAQNAPDGSNFEARAAASWDMLMGVLEACDPGRTLTVVNDSVIKSLPESRFGQVARRKRENLITEPAARAVGRA